MGKYGDAVRFLVGERTQREASLGSLLGDVSRQARSRNGGYVSQDKALKNSVWWAGLNLRANVVSTFPVDVVRKTSGGLLTSVPNPGNMVTEPYPGQDITEFLYAVQMDMDRYGNAVGIIRERNFNNKPSTVELQNMSQCFPQMDGGRIKSWRIGNLYYDPRDIWHQRQYVMAGFDLGLSPLAYAAESMGIYASAQEFALEWFGNGALPRGVLKHTRRDSLDAKTRRDAKEQFRESTQGGDIFVTGNNWEWNPATTTATSAGFLDQKAASERDVCRYVGVPASMVDVEVSTGNITYANVTQANLQFLVTQLGPSVVRTQNYWSRVALPQPWLFRFNTDALLRMDPVTKSDLLIRLSNAKLRTPSEVRALDNLAPYDDAQLAELGTFAQMGKVAAPGPVQKESAPWLVPS